MIRVLLDENLPRRLSGLLDPAIVSEAVTVAGRGWAGTKNGALLALAAAEFDVLLTLDRGIEHQQNLTGLDLCLVLIAAVSNRLDDLAPLAPELNAVLANAAPGFILRVPAG